MSVRFVDCRCGTGHSEGGYEDYLAAHIPGAAYADTERDLTGTEGGGRHPLPSAEAFAAWASAAGIGPGTLAVAYDARSPERWRGEVEPLDPVAGRIPGARNAFYREPLPAEALAAEELVFYCGSGVSACPPLHAAVLAGREDARLYPGSWSDWCSRNLPVERGDP